MKTETLDRGEDLGLKAGQWIPINDARGEAKTAMIACPGCGELGALRDHVIDGEGAVYPSFVCHECGFHANVNLEGWPP